MIEEIGKVASSVAASLSGTPVVLALIVLNLVFFTFIYFNASETRAANERNVKTLLDREAQIQNLLYNCTPTRGGQP